VFVAKVRQVLRKLLLPDIRGDDDIGGLPLFALVATIKCQPSITVSPYDEEPAEYFELFCFHGVRC
jgi:hypothetical protein